MTVAYGIARPSSNDSPKRSLHSARIYASGLSFGTSSLRATYESRCSSSCSSRSTIQQDWP